MIFDVDEEVAVEAARTLRDLGVLRRSRTAAPSRPSAWSETANRHAPMIVKPAILEWRLTTPAYNAYAPQPTLRNGGNVKEATRVTVKLSATQSRIFP